MLEYQCRFKLKLVAGFAFVTALSSIGMADAKPKIARVFQEPTRHGVHVMNIETGRLRFLGDWRHWHVSPDGKKIARGMIGGKNNAFFTLYVDSLIPRRKPRKLAQLPFGSDDSHQIVRWMGDSRRIKVDGNRGGNGKREAYLVSINRPGIATRTSLIQESERYHPKSVLSPNGRYRCGFLPRAGANRNKILVVKDARTGKEIRRLDTKRGGFLPFSEQRANPWSPDSSKVLFVLNGEAQGYALQNDRLCAFDIATGKVRTLASAVATIQDAIYSPNGQWVAFLGIPWKRPTPTNFPGKIYLARADGKMWKQITHYEKTRKEEYFQRFMDDCEIAWLSDSKQIVFRRTRYMDEII